VCLLVIRVIKNEPGLQNLVKLGDAQ